MPRHDELPVYDEVPQEWTLSSALDIPAVALSPGYVRAHIAKDDRDKIHAVEIRCGVPAGRRQCRRRLGDVFVTSHGTVLVVKALTGDRSLATHYKGTPRGGDHYPESALVEDHAIMIDDVRLATVWCRSHHEKWALDLQVLRGHVRVWRATHQKQFMTSAPPRLN